MTDPAKVKLLFGPFRRPRLRIGERVHCLYRDHLVIVHGWTDAPLSWPVCRPIEGRGRPGILVEEELACAVHGESSLALMYWWGASQRVVWCWRKALDAPRFTPGSRRLQWLNAEAGADAIRGVPRPDVAERMRQAHRELDLTRHIQPCPRPGGGEPWNEDEANLLGSAPDVELARRLGRSRSAVRAARRRNAVPPVASLRSWTPEEDALLGTMPDGELAKRLGRSAASVSQRRLKLGRPHRPRSRPWTPAEDEAVRTLPPVEAAARLGRSVWAVHSQRVRLGLTARSRTPVEPQSAPVAPLPSRPRNP